MPFSALLALALCQPEQTARQSDLMPLIAAMRANEARVETIESIDEVWWPPTAKAGWRSQGVFTRGWSRDGRWYMLMAEPEERGGEHSLYIACQERMVGLAVKSPRDPRIEQLSGVLNKHDTMLRDAFKSPPVFMGLTVEGVRGRTFGELAEQGSRHTRWMSDDFPGLPGLEWVVDSFQRPVRYRVVLDPEHGMCLKHAEQFDVTDQVPRFRLTVLRYAQTEIGWLPTAGVVATYHSYDADAYKGSDRTHTLHKLIGTTHLPAGFSKSDTQWIAALVDSGPLPGGDGIWQVRFEHRRPDEAVDPILWRSTFVSANRGLGGIDELAATQAHRTVMSAWTYAKTPLLDTLSAMRFNDPLALPEPTKPGVRPDVR